MSVRIATQNIHWPNNDSQKKRDIVEAEPGADLICFQEVYKTPIKKYLGPEWDALDSNAVGKRDIAVAWRDDLITVIRSGFFQIGRMTRGSKKVFAIAWVETEDAIFGSVHPPHGKYERENPGIKRQCADGVVLWVNAQTKPVVLGGDWNFDIHKDEFKIASRTGLTWYGGGKRGIDGFLVSPLFDVTDVREVDVISDHPVVYATIAFKPTGPVPEPVPVTRGKNLDAIEKALERALRMNRRNPMRLKLIRQMRKLLRKIPATPKRTA